MRPRSGLRRAGEWLGLVDTRPKPTARQILRAFLYLLPVLVVAAVVASFIERAGGPDWLTPIIMGMAFGLVPTLLERWSGKAR